MKKLALLLALLAGPALAQLTPTSSALQPIPYVPSSGVALSPAVPQTGSIAVTGDVSAGGVRLAAPQAPVLVPGTPFRANTYTAGAQQDPYVASSLAGPFVVVWESNLQDGSYHGIYGQRYDSAGTAAGSEFRVNSRTTDDQQYPTVAANAAGAFVVAWMSYNQDGSNYGVFAQRYAADGSPTGGEFRANTWTTNTQGYPSAAVDSSGNFVIVWQSDGQDGSDYGIHGQRYASDGTISGGEFRVNTTTSNEQRYPSVATADAGSFVVTWSSMGQDGDGYGVFAQRYSSAGAPLGSEFRVNSYTTGDQKFSRIAVGTDGGFMVVWQSAGQLAAGNTAVYGQKYDSAGAPIGPETLLSADAGTSTSQRPAVAATGAAYTVTWQSLTTQARPAVAALPNGGFVLASQDGADINAQRFTGAPATWIAR